MRVKTNRTYRYRLYPNAEQRLWFARQFGCCRFVYNHFLRARIDHYAAHKDDPTGPKGKGLTFAANCRALTQLKKQPETAWLADMNAQSLQGALVDLDRAYNNFFNKRAQFPRFKHRGHHDAFRVPQSFKVATESGTLTMPKVGHIKTVFHRPLEGDPKHVTITRSPSGRYHASICVEIDLPEPVNTGTVVIGVDLGVRDLVVTSEGEKIACPRHLRKAEKRLKRAQRTVSRRTKGSSGREKARRVLARQHEKVRDRRYDFIHKVTRKLVCENQAISVESLNVKGMLRNHCLAKSISDAAWGETLRQLAYKGAWYGCRVFEVDRFFPSSKRCSACGWINEGLRLKDRVWTCPHCGMVHDRDINAAINIRDFGTAGVAGTVSSDGDNAGGDPESGSSKPEASLFSSGMD